MSLELYTKLLVNFTIEEIWNWFIVNGLMQIFITDTKGENFPLSLSIARQIKNESKLNLLWFFILYMVFCCMDEVIMQSPNLGK